MIRILIALVCLIPSLAQARQGEASAHSPTPVAVAPPTITLLDPGAEPRQALRFRIAPDLRQSVQFRMVMTTSMSMSGAEAPETRMPAVVMTMNVAVKSVADDGDVNYEMTVTDAKVEAGPGDPEELVKALRESIKPVKGLRGVCTVSNRGITRSASIELPGDAANPAALQGFREQLDQAMFSLPEEPIGKGARWTVESDGVTQAIRLKQKTTYTLTGIQGDTASFEVVIAQTAGEQELKSPDMPPGASVTLRSLNSEGSGSIETVLTRLIPQRSQAKLKSVMDAVIGQGGLGMGMKQTMTVEVQITDASAGNPSSAHDKPADPGK